MSRSDAWHERPSFRFLVAGGANTLATGLLVGLLSLLVPAAVAYTTAFAIGLAWATVVNGRWVFRSRLSPVRIALFASAYVVIYLIGLAIVRVIAELHGPAMLTGSTVLITAPLSFIAGRFIFTNDRPTAGTAS